MLNASPGRLPLDGVRIVAIEQAIAVPLATRHMADLGASVVKIERPEGDFARGYDSLADGVSIHFAWTNRGKKSVVLDLKTDSGREAALRFASEADVLVHNMGPGVMQRLGLDWDVVHARAPSVIYCELSGYGSSGPLAGRKAYDLLIQSEVGAAAVSGSPEAPAKVGVSLVDISGAMYILSATLAALIERQVTSDGRLVSLNLFDATAEWMSVPLLQAKYTGQFHRSGRYHNSIFPYGPFPCADGEIVIAVQNDREWERFCRGVLQMDEMAEDSRYLSNEGRHIHRGALYDQITRCLTGFSLAEVVSRLESSDVPFAEYRSVEEVVNHPHLVDRHRWYHCSTAASGVELLKSPFDQEGLWPTPPVGVPGLGEHTQEELDRLGSVIAQ